ncbi:hypothetical protein [Roseateles sp. BYS87W]|uniref:Uncharacterized protein n=1 Tax=Pelomonas baiyunensis TaxID=3299026 RepID=A0ABW7H2P6_9BURK
MQTSVVFDIPTDIAGRIALGQYERVGGVVRERATGQVVTWLRETGTSGGGKALELLGSVGSAASILNLGATVGFGIATLRKLDKIEGKLDHISNKLNEIESRIAKLHWTVELGFAQTLHALNQIAEWKEMELSAALSSAANLAWSSQFLEPGSTQRVMRLENALHSANEAKEKLVLLARRETDEAVEGIRKSRQTDAGFNFDSSAATTAIRLRQAVAASALCASISAEANDLLSAAAALKQDYSVLNGLYTTLGLAGIGQGLGVVELLGHTSKNGSLSTGRLDSLVRRFRANGILDLVDMRNTIEEKADPSNSGGEHIDAGAALKIAGTIIAGVSPWPFPTKISGGTAKPEPIRVSTVSPDAMRFFGMLDQVAEDMDRLNGHSLEYESGALIGASIHEYRQAFCVDDAPDSASIAYFKIAA